MTDVFISYSRKDQDFSNWLVRSFEHNQREVWLDKDDILPTSQWLAEIYAGIEAADNFVFIISPDSVRSQVCGWEVAHAVKHNKRLIPVLRRDVNFKELERLMADPVWEGMLPEYWKALADLNWIMFQSNADRDQIFGTLFEAIDMDIDYIHQHSSILVDALAWDAGARKASDTLRGPSLESAEQWLAQSGGKDPQPTELHREYIKASRIATKKRRMVIMLASGFALIALTIVGVIAAFQYQDAAIERMAKRSLSLSANAQDAFELGDSGLGLALALEAVKTEDPPLAFLSGAITPPLVSKQTLEELAYRPGTVAVFDNAETGRFGPNENSIYLAGGSALVERDITTGAELARFEFDAAIVEFEVQTESGVAFLALEDGSIRRLDLNSGLTLDYGLGSRPIELGATGATFVHAADDFTLVLRDAVSGAVIHRFTFNSSISDLAYNEKTSQLLVGLGNSEMSLWNTTSGELVSTLNWYEDNSVQLNADPQDCLLNGISIASVALSSDGRYAVYAMRGGFPFAVLACQLEEILVWDLDQMKVVKHLIGHSLDAGVESLAISPKGDFILSGGGNELFLWDVSTGKLVQQLPGFADSADQLILVDEVSISQSGSYGISSTDNGAVQIWELTPGTEMMRVDLGFGGGGYGNLIQAVATTPGGDIALVGGQGTMRANPSTTVVDMKTGATLAEFDMHNDIYDLVVTPDQKRALEYSADGLFLVDIATGVTIREFDVLPIGFLDFSFPALRPLVAISPDGNTLFTQGCLYSVATGEKLSCHDFGQRGLYSADGQWIVSAIGMETLVIWNPLNGQEMSRFNPGINLGGLFALGLDDSELLVGSESKLVLINLNTKEITREFIGHDGPVYAGDVSPDGKIIISGSLDQTFRIWDRELGIELRSEQQGEAVFGAIFSEDGRSAISGAHQGELVRWRVTSMLDQLVEWVYAHRYIPEMSCYEKDEYEIAPPCNPGDYAWLGLNITTQMDNVVVESVESGSPAEDAGMEFGDQIYSIGGHYVDAADQINKILDEYRPGDLIVVQGYRSATGEGFEMKITLDQRP